MGNARNNLQICIFCDILSNQTYYFLYYDNTFFAINDINQATAQAHILIISKKHIKNALEVDSSTFLIEMQRVGEQVLDKVCTERMISKEYRFGFHLPPVNSVDHIHLHCFVLPITSWKYNWLVYGWGLNSVESVIKKIDKIQNTYTDTCK